MYKLLIVALAAVASVALAAPDADADAYRTYSTHPFGLSSRYNYRAFPARARYLGYAAPLRRAYTAARYAAPYSYGYANAYTTGYHGLYKRDAEADAYYGYAAHPYGAVSHSYEHRIHRRPSYLSYAAPLRSYAAARYANFGYSTATRYADYGYAAPYAATAAYTTGYHGLFKRDAEADAYLAYNAHPYGAVSSSYDYRAHPIRARYLSYAAPLRSYAATRYANLGYSTAGYADYGYAAPYSTAAYGYGNAYTTGYHGLYKRDADADAYFGYAAHPYGAVSHSYEHRVHPRRSSYLSYAAPLRSYAAYAPDVSYGHEIATPTSYTTASVSRHHGYGYTAARYAAPYAATAAYLY